MLYKFINIIIFLVLPCEILEIETLDSNGNKIEALITIGNHKIKSFGIIYLPRSDQVYNKNTSIAHCNTIDTTFTKSIHYYKIILDTSCHADSDDY